MGWTVWSEKLAGTTQHPLATVVFKDKMHVFAVGANDKTVWVKSSADGENWGDWSNFEKQTDAPVTPVVFDDVLFVFAKELDDKISVRSKATRVKLILMVGIQAIPTTTNLGERAFTSGIPTVLHRLICI